MLFPSTKIYFRMDSGNFTMGPDMDAEEAVIQVSIIYRPDVAGAVLQSPLFVTY